MRSMYIGKFFVTTVKKKPKMYEVYKNMHLYTPQQIMSMDFPLWYREKLAELCSRGIKWSPELDDSLCLNFHNINTVYSDEDTNKYEVREWLGIEFELYELERKSFFIIEPGNLFLILDRTKGIILYDHFKKTIRPDIVGKFFQFSRPIGSMTQQQFHQFRYERLNKNFADH